MIGEEGEEAERGEEEAKRSEAKHVCGWCACGGSIRGIDLCEKSITMNGLTCLAPCISRKIETLVLNATTVTDFAPLARLTRLETFKYFGVHEGVEALFPAVLCTLPLYRLMVSHLYCRTVPPAIGAMRALRHLDLVWCGLATLPAEFAQLRLVMLDLSNNDFHTLPALPATLESLTLSKNPLETLDGIEALPLLMSLLLVNCWLRRLPDTIGRLSELRLLYLNRNPLDVYDADCVAGLPTYMSALDLDYIYLDDRQMGRLGLLAPLRWNDVRTRLLAGEAPAREPCPGPSYPLGQPYKPHRSKRYLATHQPVPRAPFFEPPYRRIVAPSIEPFRLVQEEDRHIQGDDVLPDISSLLSPLESARLEPATITI